MIQNIKGTKDILPSEVRKWQRLESVFRTVTDLFGYEEIRTPIIEYSELFHRSAGEGSDVVNKEMYVFKDRSDDSICLRPELTAAVARVILQNTLLRAHPTMRLWYYGPCFRYERPQLGRQRQFHQIGAELIGTPHAEADADVIQLAHAILTACGIDDVRLEINSIGSAVSRQAYKGALVDFFRAYVGDLSEDSRRRLETNPLRILDSKDESDRRIITGAPRIHDFLDDPSVAHFERLQSLLNALGISFDVNPMLVRGLDYYTDTVFEFKTSKLGAQDAVGGGGRYDSLFESLQGPPTPGVGFGIGVERLLMLADSGTGESPIPTVYLISSPEYAQRTVPVVSRLRAAGIRCLHDVQHKSFKAQMKDADRCHASCVVFMGESEISDNTFTIKNMNSGVQTSIPMDVSLLIESIHRINSL
ncbi:MAG: histidine--tRNA ligase [Candidatus Kapaibacterium sp.]